MKSLYLSLFLAIAAMLSSCTPIAPQPAPLFSSVLPTSDISNSPVSTVSALDAMVIEPKFGLDPLTSTSTVATGTAPKGFSLVIVDATSAARILGTGKPDENGNFSIRLKSAPRKGHVIGLTLELTQEQQSSPSFIQKLYETRGAGYRLIPQLLTIYAGCTVPDQ